MIILSVEGTAHTFGIAILKDNKILADVRDSYSSKTGIIPVKAAEHHKNVANKLLNKALKKANLRLDEIDLIAYSRSPGLAPCLLIVKEFVERLVKKTDKPFLGVNHCVAHLASGKLFCNVKNPIFLNVSGANTQIISIEGNRARILGETLDIGLGNALDKFGRNIGLGFPAGNKIEKLAKNGEYVELPYTVKGMDLSFSGIITDAVNKFNKGFKKEDLCFSLQEILFSMLTEVSERALAHTDKDEIVLIGGVAANKRLREMLEKMCLARNARFFSVPIKYSGDNAVNIAYLGFLESKYRKDKKIEIDPFERTDQVNIEWLR